MEDFDFEKAILAVDSHHGIYAPQFFIEEFADKMVGLPDDVKQDLLAGPDNENYWDAWETVVDNCTVTIDGNQYSIYPGEDVWLIPII